MSRVAVATDAASTVRKKANPEQQLRAARDLRLIEAYHAGRTEAFDELVVAYDGHVRRVLAQLNVVPAEVEDLTQEVFLRVFRNLHRFRGQSSFYTWLYRITVNVFFDHNKKRKRADVRLQRLQNALVDVGTTRLEGEDLVRGDRGSDGDIDRYRPLAAFPGAGASQGAAAADLNRSRGVAPGTPLGLVAAGAATPSGGTGPKGFH